VNILAISGSLRRASHNSALLAEAARHGNVTVYDGLADLPLYNEDIEHAPGPAVERLRRSIASADALLIATPEYNGSIPGGLKNALDWASRPYGASALIGKPAAVVSASTGQFGAAWAQAEVRKVLSISAARVLPLELAVPHAHSRFDANGQLEPEYADALRAVVHGLSELVDEAEAEAAEDAAEAMAAA
jgi:chromate reductase